MANPDVPCLTIALIAEQRSEYLQMGYAEEDCAALPHDGEVKTVLDTLKLLGHRVVLVQGLKSLIKHLARGDYRGWDLGFNMSQGFHGTSRESQVPALLEAYQIPYTFADAATMSACQNKAITKIILCYNQIPTAPFCVLKSNDLASTLDRCCLQLSSYPLFLKPVSEGSSKGIDLLNKVNERAELEAAVKELDAKLPGQDILVESFLAGRDLTVSIFGTGSDCQVIGVREHIWQDGDDKNGDHTKVDFSTRLSKASVGNGFIWNDSPDMSDPQVLAACQVALDAWNVLGCRDAGRVDIRFDKKGPGAVPNVLEINPIAGLLPRYSPLPSSAESNGMPFKHLLTEIIESALQRTPRGTKRTHAV